MASIRFVAFLGILLSTSYVHAQSANIKSLGSAKCINVIGGSTTDGTLVNQLDCSTQKNLMFGGVQIGSDKNLIKADHSQKCLDVSSVASAQQLKQNECDSAKATQRFNFVLNSDGTYGIRNGSLCVGIRGALTAAGTAVELQTCSSTSTFQKFQISNFANAFPSFLSWGPDMFSWVPGTSKTISGTTFRFTSTGELQVLRGSTILWRSKTSASCSATSCRAVLQGDGNLVIYGPSGALWSSATYNNGGGTLVFQPWSGTAYLTVLDNAYNVKWTSGGTGYRPMMISSRAGTKARTAKSFFDSIGVNTHMDQYEGNADVVLSKLKYLGIKRIRDHFDGSAARLANYKTLAAGGIRFDMLDYSNNFTTLISHAETLASIGTGVLMAVEGPNEINNFSFSCNGSSWAGGWPNSNGPAAQCFMTNFYNALNASTKLKGVQMYNLTGHESVRNPDSYGLLNLANHADFGNIHVYPPSTSQPYNNLLVDLGRSYNTVLPSRAVITETGYTDAKVSRRVQAIYNLNIFLDAFLIGYSRTFMYELTDNQWEGYGFYDTANQPKLAAVALHNLTSLIGESTEISSPGTLSYSLTGATSTTKTLLLQKTNGRYYLIIWREAPIWNGSAEIAVAPVAMTLNFGRTVTTANRFVPLVSDISRQTVSGVSSISLQVGVEQQVIEIIP